MFSECRYHYRIRRGLNPLVKVTFIITQSGNANCLHIPEGRDVTFYERADLEGDAAAPSAGGGDSGSPVSVVKFPNVMHWYHLHKMHGSPTSLFVSRLGRITIRLWRHQGFYAGTSLLLSSLPFFLRPSPLLSTSATSNQQLHRPLLQPPNTIRWKPEVAPIVPSGEKSKG